MGSDARSASIWFVLLGVLLSACGSAGPTAPVLSPGATTDCTMYLNKVDELTKPSVEPNRYVFAVLLDLTWPPLNAGCYDGAFGPDLWTDAIWDRPTNRIGVPGPDPDQLAADIATRPSTRAGLCQALYDSPAVKLLDPMHPDAVQPVLPTVSISSEHTKGWVTWQVETRADCRLRFSAYLVNVAQQPDPETDPLLELAPFPGWTQDGPQANEPVPSPLSDEMEREWSRWLEATLPPHDWSVLASVGPPPDEEPALSSLFEVTGRGSTWLLWSNKARFGDPCRLSVSDLGSAESVPSPSPDPYGFPAPPGRILLTLADVQPRSGDRVPAGLSAGLHRLLVETTCDNWSVELVQLRLLQ